MKCCIWDGCSTCQDIPARFVRDHGDKFQEKIILERYGRCGENWPVRLTIQHREEGGVRVYCCNNSESGWRDFVVKNQLKIGDVLLFNLVAMSRFVVHVNPEFDELGVSFRMELIDMKSSACCSCFQAAFNCGGNSQWKRVDVLDYLLKPLEDLLCTCDHHHHHGQSDSKDSARKPLRFPQRRNPQPELKNISERVPQRNSGARFNHQHFRTVSKSSSCQPQFVKELCQSHVEGSLKSPISSAKLVSKTLFETE